MALTPRVADATVSRSFALVPRIAETSHPDPLADDAAAMQQLEVYLGSLTQDERDDLIDLIRRTAWRPTRPIFPQTLQDGSRTGWFSNQLLMRKKIDGNWIYRKPTAAEYECEERLDAQFQAW